MGVSVSFFFLEVIVTKVVSGFSHTSHKTCEQMKRYMISWMISSLNVPLTMKSSLRCREQTDSSEAMYCKRSFTSRDRLFETSFRFFKTVLTPLPLPSCFKIIFGILYL